MPAGSPCVVVGGTNVCVTCTYYCGAGAGAGTGEELFLGLLLAEENTRTERAREVWGDCASGVLSAATIFRRLGVSSRLGDETISPLIKDRQ